MLYYKNRDNEVFTENEIRQVCEDCGGSQYGEEFYKWLTMQLKNGNYKRITVDEARLIEPYRVAYFERERGPLCTMI